MAFYLEKINDHMGITKCNKRTYWKTTSLNNKKHIGELFLLNKQLSAILKLAVALLAIALFAGVLLARALWAAHFKLDMEKDHIILTMIINEHDVINEHTGKKVGKINEHSRK